MTYIKISIALSLLICLFNQSVLHTDYYNWKKVYQIYPIDSIRGNFTGIDSADSLNIMAIADARHINCRCAWWHILKSTDGGLNWETIYKDSIPNRFQRPYPRDIAYPTLDFCIAGGDSNYVIKTTNGGKDWKEYYLNIPYEKRGIQEIRMLDEKHGVISTSNNIYISHDGFETYRRLDLPGRYVVIDLSILSPFSIKYLGREIINDTLRNQKLLYTTNEGDSWQEYDFSEYKYPRAMHFVDSLYGYVVGYEWTGIGGRQYDIIHGTTDGGKTWELQLDTILVVPSGLSGMDFLDRENGIAVGQAGKIYWTHDAGKTWLYDSNASIYRHQPATMYVTMLGKHTAVICDFLSRIFRSEFVSTGVEDENTIAEFKIFPNPVGEYIEISGLDVNPRFKSWVDGDIGEIRIYDVLGECVKEIPPTPLLQRGIIRVDVSVLPAGVYFVRIGNYTDKFVVVR